MHPLTFRRLLIHLVLSLGAGSFMALLDHFGMNGLVASSLGPAFWMGIMALGWFQCLIALLGITSLFGGTRVPGLLIVLGAALLVALPFMLEARVFVDVLVDPAIPFSTPVIQTFGKCLAVCLCFSMVAWGAVERRDFGLPPCSWTMMGAGGPGAEVDMDAAMERLNKHLSRKRAESPPPPLPFYPPVPATPTEVQKPPYGPGGKTESQPEPEAGSEPEPEAGSEAAPIPPSPADGPDQAAPPALRLARMPDGLLGTILCIEMEDHYLRVHTDQGLGAILGRLGDAETELGQAAGMKVHRSWWVARTAVVGSKREGRNLTLLLSNGMAVPVSRANQPKVADAGWLSD